MSTEAVLYQGKYFWIDIGVTEVWLITLLKEILYKRDEQWLINFRNEIETMLEANWITGLVQFDSLLNSEDRKKSFKTIVMEANSYLKKLVEVQSDAEFLKVGYKGDYYSAYRPFIIPQIERLYDLIYHPEKIINNGEQYSDEVGWFIA